MSEHPIARTTGERGKSPVFIFCDHASNVVPDGYDRLGLTPAQMDDHIAYDPGSARLAEMVAEELDARVLYCGFSRLLIDPNRGLDRDDLILPVSDTVYVPGNQNLSERERRHRLATYHEPYHAHLAEELDALMAAHEDPFVISLHSFCRALRSETVERPWEAGLLWRDDQESAIAVMERLSAAGVEVGDNKPYSAKIYNYSINRHVGPRKLRHVTLEIRQDLLTTQKGLDRWKSLLFPAFQALMKGKLPI